MSTNGGGATGQEAIVTDIITLSRFITEEQTKHKEATGDFTYAALIPPLATSSLLTGIPVSYARLFSSLSNP